MRTAAALLLVLTATACSDRPSDDPTAALPAGCGLVPRSKVVGLLGDQVTAVTHGSVRALTARHRPLRCSNTVPGRPERYVTVTAQYHPKPFRLPAQACSEGWVYAGTPDKYAPACQQVVDGHGTTQLIVRWQPYVVRVGIGRSDRSWGGDPEAALAMSRVLAQGLGVQEASGDG